MAYKEVFRVEIVEVIRRWQAGESQRHIAEGTGLARDTVAKYVSAAEALGVARDGPAASEEQLSRLAAISRTGPRRSGAPTEELPAPWSDQIYQWLTGDKLQLPQDTDPTPSFGGFGLRLRLSGRSLKRFLASAYADQQLCVTKYQSAPTCFARSHPVQIPSPRLWPLFQLPCRPILQSPRQPELPGWCRLPRL